MTTHPAQGAPALSVPLADLLDHAPASWRGVVHGWRARPAGQALQQFIAARQAAGATIYPADVLRALTLTPRDQVKVVILGQDPYHGAGQAEGLAFSVPPGVPRPPSLRNIAKELARDLGLSSGQSPSSNGHLGAWARQGVLLLNAVLTVEDGKAAAHARQGWEALTDDIIQAAAQDPGAKVFMLWGAYAQAKAPLIEAAGAGRHAMLRANHPSPLSALRPPVPFIGCGHFGLANRFLAGQGAAGIDWAL